MSDELRTLVDRMAIADVMNRYALAVDGRDWVLYREVFSADAVIDYTDSGGIRGGLEEIVGWLGEVLAPFAGLQHNMTNHLVDIDGDQARACTNYLAFHTVATEDGAETLFSMGGFYQDRLIRTGAGWRIRERVELGVWMDGPYPDDVAKPPWYGRAGHHVPHLPE